MKSLLLRRFGGLLGGLRGGKGRLLHHSLCFVSSFSSSSRSYDDPKDHQTNTTKRLLELLNKKRANGTYVEGGLFEHQNQHQGQMKKGQMVLLYRKVLRQAKQFPDPTLRHFGYHRIAEQFRRHRYELSKKKIRVWKKELTKQSRRMERALRGDRDDYRHFLELAYGMKGRFGHLMRRFEEERKIEKTRRQEKFLLKPIDEETMETFSVKNLVRMVEDTSLREGAKFEEQMEVLKRKVPTFYYDRRKSFSSRRQSGKNKSDDESKSNACDSSNDIVADDIFAYEDSRARSRATEDATDAIELGDAEDDAEEKEEKEEVILLRSKLKHWHVHEDTAFEKYAPSRLYHGFDGNWENNHVAMLKSIFEPTMIDRLDFMPRKWFRTYRRTLFEFEGESNSSNKNQQNVKISSDALKDVQRTTPLRIVLPAEDDEQKEQEYSNDDFSCDYNNNKEEEEKSMSANKKKSTKAGKIKLAESTIVGAD